MTNFGQLRVILDERFNESELRDLCFDLDIDYDSLSGTSKSDKARELIDRLRRYQRIPALQTRLQQFRPDISLETVVDSVEQQSLLSPSQVKPEKGTRLCGRISQRNYWEEFERAAVHAATAGGMAAMGFYRNAMPWPSDLAAQGKNPSTYADLVATARILETIDSFLPRLVRPDILKCHLYYLAEETKFKEWFDKNVRGDVPTRVLEADEFFSPQENAIRILVDGIDGTGNFSRGIPLFCSTVAILIDDQPRVSAIYDPIHHTVYSAVLKGPYHRPAETAAAWSWQVATGERTDLIKQAREAERLGLKQEAIGTHLTRTNKTKLHEYLKIPDQSENSLLEHLAKASGAVYMLNSGILAMAHVAVGSLGGFINNVTNLWDIAAGEVFVQACDGIVTNFNGGKISYSSNEQVSIVAAKKHIHSMIVDILNGEL